MSLVNKYILEHWVNGDYETRFLRFINRETKNYYISEVQRYPKSWNNNPLKWFFHAKLARRYRKIADSPGFKRYMGRRDNPDGKMNYSVADNPCNFKCVYTFEELFKTDLRTIQKTNDYPLAYMLRESRRDSWDDVYFTLLEYGMDDIDSLPKIYTSSHEKLFYDYIKELFGVDKVYQLISAINERGNSILYKSGTLFHITHFGKNKKYTLEADQQYNHTIFYWLFDDCLVFQYESGRDSH